MALVVVMNDGARHELPDPSFSDLVKFERQYKVSASRLNEEQYAEWIGYLAWVILRRSEAPVGDFEPFLETVKSIHMVTGEDGQGNAPPAPAEGASAA